MRLKNGDSLKSIGADLLAMAGKQPRPDGLDAAANDLAVSEFLLLATMHKEAVEIAQGAVAIRARLLPANHPEQLVAAIAAANPEQDPEVATALWQALTARSTALSGATHPLTGMCEVAASSNACAAGKAAEGLQAADRAVAALDRDPMPHPALAILCSAPLASRRRLDPCRRGDRVR